MLKIKSTNRFKKDFKLLVKSGKNMSLLYNVIKILQEQKPLPSKYRDHALRGIWKGYRDCHIEPDWILIYQIDNEYLILKLTRTGTHNNLFK